MRPNLLADEDLPPEPGQKRSVEKRTVLKAAALALFGDRGYEATSVNEIATRAQLPVGTFYQHFRSKRQLLLVLMDELLEGLSRLNLSPTPAGDVRAGLRALLSAAFARDLRYLGAYRAWREASFSDADLARLEALIRKWTTGRLLAVFQHLGRLPGARPGVDQQALARAMDGFFWNLLEQTARMPKAELEQWLDVSTHLIYHALFLDGPALRRGK